MKYGMNLLLWTSDVTEEHFSLLENIKEWGYDGVELPIFDMDAAKFEKTGDQLRQLELDCTAVTVCTPDANPISPDAGIRDAAVEHLKKAIDMCAITGATYLCGPIHSALGEFTGQGRTEDEWKWGKETLAKTAEYAGENNVTLVCEYLNRFECYFLNCAADTARFVEEVGHPNLKMMYDTFHAHIEEKQVSSAIGSCADHLVHVHVSENDRSTPGAGSVPWNLTFAKLKEIGYDGWLTIEAFGLALPDLAAATRIWRRMFETEERVARDGLNFMKSRWEM